MNICIIFLKNSLIVAELYGFRVIYVYHFIMIDFEFCNDCELSQRKKTTNNSHWPITKMFKCKNV